MQHKRATYSNVRRPRMELEGFPSRLSGEVYLLILDFLERSPCVGSAEELKRELSRFELVPPRYDWRGRPHARDMEDFSQEYASFPRNPLLRLLKDLCQSGSPSLFLSGKAEARRSVSLLERLRANEHGHGPPSPLAHMVPSLKCLRRTLGHLSSVFCVLFDRTGSLIFTGADDLLVKCWSLRNGRLLYTFRGASSEISDLAVSHDNRLLAAGSCDKIVRVWCLFTAAPVAVLAKQQGLITAVSFCPLQGGKRRYLACTSGEGAVSFWGYAYNDKGEALFEEAPTKYLEKIRPGGAKMICASFSPGGIFYCVGSVDHHVRVYKMDLLEGPQRILEDNAHTDRVDSIQWCHGSGLKFLSGSKDGTARIWSYGCLKWTSQVLKMAEEGPAGDPEASKKVTMVAWSLDDNLAITAVSDNSIRLWDSRSGASLGSLLGHSNEIYVMEPHPLCCSIFLTAAHDGQIMLWNLDSKTCLMKYNNAIPSDVNAALYDAKWTPDGTAVACTDSLGHLLILGFGSSDPFKLLPKEVFFHTDYRPLLRDSFHNVLDEQTQLPPHLLPSPFLVDSEGFPYGTPIQRLVRGREHLGNTEVLAPRGPEPSFNINNSLQVNEEEQQEQPDAGANLLQEAQALARAAVQDNRLYEEAAEPPPPQEEAEIEQQQKPFNRFILSKKDSRFKYSILRSLQTIKEFSRLEARLFQADREKFQTDHDYHAVAANVKKSAKKAATRRGLSPEKEESEEEDVEADNQTSDCSLDESDFSSIEEEETSSDDEDAFANDHSDWGSENEAGTSQPPKKRSPNKKGKRNAAVKCGEQMLLSAPGGDLADIYTPSSWLSEYIPRKTPYFPQIGDVLMYFKRGHEKYLDLVRDRKVYIINMKEQTWIKKKLGESVMAKIIGIQFEIKPPRLAVLKFQILNQDSGNPTGETFTLKYHDMNDVVDFLVLHQLYSASSREWVTEDRIRCQIDDCWWKGTVKAVGPETSTSTGGSSSSNDDLRFLSILCHWDNGEKEYLSPWDLEELTTEAQDIPDGAAVSPKQLKSCLYQPSAEEWNDIGRDIERVRIAEALGTIMGLAKAEPFNSPVDQADYHDYFYCVEYPMDLNLIKSRVDNNFYRRIASIEYDLKYIYENAEAYNLPKSDIVKSAKVITMLAVQIINDPAKTKEDVSEIYHNLIQDFQWSSSEEEEMDEDIRVKLSNAIRPAPESLNPKRWKQDCSCLLKKAFTQPFSAPFREPVSEIDFPDYTRFITTPIDLSSIKESLLIGNYASPNDFQKDIQLMISNSREFNTNPKSQILHMTNDLEDWIAPKIRDLISNWKKTTRRLTLARRKHKIKKEERSRPTQGPSSSAPVTGGTKGKGVGKGKSNALSRTRLQEDSLSSSDEDAMSFTRSSRAKRKTPVKTEEDHSDEEESLASWKLRKKRPAFNEEDSPAEEEEECKPKPQRSAKPKMRLPSSSSESEVPPALVEVPPPTQETSSCERVVTQVSRSGRVVRKSAWKDYTYSDDEEGGESDTLARRSRKPPIKVVPNDDLSEEEEEQHPHRSRRPPTRRPMPPNAEKRKKKQSEESVSEFSDSEDYSYDDEEGEESPAAAAEGRRGSGKRASVRPYKYREDEEESRSVAAPQATPASRSRGSGGKRTSKYREDSEEEERAQGSVPPKSRSSGKRTSVCPSKYREDDEVDFDDEESPDEEEAPQSQTSAPRSRRSGKRTSVRPSKYREDDEEESLDEDEESPASPQSQASAPRSSRSGKRTSVRPSKYREEDFDEESPYEDGEESPASPQSQASVPRSRVSGKRATVRPSKYREGDEEESPYEDDEAAPRSRVSGKRATVRPSKYQEDEESPYEDDEAAPRSRVSGKRATVRPSKYREDEESPNEDDEAASRSRVSGKRATVRPSKYQEDEESPYEDDEAAPRSRVSGVRRRPSGDEDFEEDSPEEDEESLNDEEEYLHEERSLSQRNGLRSRQQTSKKPSRKRRKRSASSNSSEQENRRPLRRRAAAPVKKLKEQSSSSSNNELSSEDEGTRPSRRKKPRII